MSVVPDLKILETKDMQNHSNQFYHGTFFSSEKRKKRRQRNLSKKKKAVGGGGGGGGGLEADRCWGQCKLYKPWVCQYGSMYELVGLTVCFSLLFSMF